MCNWSLKNIYIFPFERHANLSNEDNHNTYLSVEVKYVGYLIKKNNIFV